MTLDTAQIAGIILGVAGAIILALTAILCARRARRRNFPNMEDEFYPMDNKSDNAPSIYGAGVGGGGGGGGGGKGGVRKRLTTIFHISPPILKQPQPQQQQFPPPPREYTPTPPLPNLASQIDRNTIGLAISRPRSDMVPKRQLQQEQPPPQLQQAQRTVPPPNRNATPELLPNQLALPPPVSKTPSPTPKPAAKVKPALTLNIPAASSKFLRPPSSQPPQTDRTSTMSNMTAFADLDTEAQEGAQIWRPPPSDPQSAKTYYVADKWGNWVLSSNQRQSQLLKVTEVAELDTYTPLTKSPIERQEEQKQEQEQRERVAMAAAVSAATNTNVDIDLVTKPQPAFLASDPVTSGPYSSISRSSSVYSQASAPRSGILGPYGPGGARVGGGNLRSNNSSGRRNMNMKLERSNTGYSRDSATTINTSSSDAWEDGILINTAEEPAGHLSTVLSPVMESPSPVRTSPTAIGRSPVKYPKIPGRLDGATLRLVPPPKRPDFILANSPPGQPSPTLGAVVPVHGSPSAIPAPLNPRRFSTKDRSRQFPPLPQTSGSGFSPEKKQQTVPRFPSPPPAVRTPVDDAIRLQHEQQSRFRFPPRNDSRPQKNNNTTPFPIPRLVVDTNVPGQPPMRPHISSFISPVSATTASSATSSLLAKRVGAHRAAALSLENSSGKKGGSWSRQDMYSPGTPRGLPATPLWHPKLTPTRRGDDLFLNVQ